MRPPPATLLRAYARTEYRAAGAVARIDCRSPGIDATLRRLGVHQGAFVTAWNPFSRRRPQGWNRRMQARLEQAVRRLPSVSGKGESRGWAEDHLLVGADPRRVWRLGLRFRQQAIVTVRIGGRARLRTRGVARAAATRYGAPMELSR